MSVIEEIDDYLGAAVMENGAFYLATEDGDKPAMRPLAFKMAMGGKLYLGVGTFKDCFKQIEANPHVQLVALKDGGSWLRVSATARISDDPALVEEVWRRSPDLKPLYDAHGWQMGVFSLEDGTAQFIENAMQVVRTERF